MGEMQQVPPDVVMGTSDGQEGPYGITWGTCIDIGGYITGGSCEVISQAGGTISGSAAESACSSSIGSGIGGTGVGLSSGDAVSGAANSAGGTSSCAVTAPPDKISRLATEGTTTWRNDFIGIPFL